MHELAFGTLSNNKTFGNCLNAIDNERTAGGSSGGSGGAVGAGNVLVALGTDTGGSIRIPAVFNGVYGLRPSVNRWPGEYGLKLSHLRDTVGPIA